MLKTSKIMLCLGVTLSLGMAPVASSAAPPRDIRELTEHFTTPTTTQFGHWMFAPADEIERVTTAEHPGIVAIHPSHYGQDIKGLLKAPIKIDDYPLPWQFQCSFMQNFDALTGRTPAQANYAIGLNLAVTFSDPATWPKDHTQTPPETHSVQLLVAHLGNYGEVGKGLPQLLSPTNTTPETFVVWGRGDIAGPAAADWHIPTILIGDGARYGGPSSNQLYFRATVESPTELTVTIKFDASHGWNIRHIDVSKYGKITGVWEIGPIISGDRWLPDVLAPQLGVKPPPAVLPPDPKLTTYVDYCVFMSAGHVPLEQLSDEFNIPGYLGQWQIQEQDTIVENYSHPGWLGFHMLGPDMGSCLGAAGVVNLSLKRYKPPFEIELCVLPPPNKYPWNFYYNFGLYDGEYEDPHWLQLIGKPVPAKQGHLLGWWQPGIQCKGPEGIEPFRTRMNNPIDMEWEKPVPQSILGAKPVYMLLQVNADHLRMGFRAKPDDPWYLSKIKDTRPNLGAPIGQIGPHHALSFSTGPAWGGLQGLPAYQSFYFDYIRYRYGLMVH